MPAHRLCFKQLYFMRGMGLKGGDLMVGAGAEGMGFNGNTCTVEGRDRQHDPMIMQWCFRAQSPSHHNNWGPNKRRTIESVTVPPPQLETVSEVDETDDSEVEPDWGRSAMTTESGADDRIDMRSCDWCFRAQPK